MSEDVQVVEKRGRGRPKKEKVAKEEKPKRQLLTEEQRKANYNRANCDYTKRRRQFGSHLVTMLKHGLIGALTEDARQEISQWAEKCDIKITPRSTKIEV